MIGCLRVSLERNVQVACKNIILAVALQVRSTLTLSLIHIEMCIRDRSIENYSAEQILLFAEYMNSLPRKSLGYYTPDDLFEAYLDTVYAVSYTHLDVYKRQELPGELAL